MEKNIYKFAHCMYLSTSGVDLLFDRNKKVNYGSQTPV